MRERAGLFGNGSRFRGLRHSQFELEQPMPGALFALTPHSASSLCRLAAPPRITTVACGKVMIAMPTLLSHWKLLPAERSRHFRPSTTICGTTTFLLSRFSSPSTELYPPSPSRRRQAWCSSLTGATASRYIRLQSSAFHYTIDGKQFVVIAAGTFRTPQGDALIAFALE